MSNIAIDVSVADANANRVGVRAGDVIDAITLQAAEDRWRFTTVDFVRTHPRILIQSTIAFEWHGRVSGSSEYFPIPANTPFAIDLHAAVEDFYVKAADAGTVRVMVGGRVGEIN